MPESGNARFRTQLPLVLVIVSLVSLVIMPALIQRRISHYERDISEIAEPASDLVSAIQIAISHETAGTRGFLLTGDTTFGQAHRRARALRRHLYDELVPLARAIGPDAYELTEHLGELLTPSDAVLDSLYNGEISVPAYTTRLPMQQIRFEQTLLTAARIQLEIDEFVEERTARIQSVERNGTIFLIATALLSLVSALLVARLGRGYRNLIRSLERRGQLREHLAQAGQELSAVSHLRDVARIVANSSVAGTGATGAYVELVDDAGEGSTVEVLAAAGSGVPPIGIRIPYPGSLSEGIIESDRPEAFSEIDVIGERMAPYLRENCAGCTGIILPLSAESNVLGALVALRNPGQGNFTRAEASYLRALGFLAISAIRRVRLFEQLTDAELKFRQIADHVREVIWLGTPNFDRRLYVNPAYERVYGVDKQTLYDDPRSLLEFIHPDDRQHLIDAIAELRNGREFSIEYRITRPDGQLRWIHSRGYPIYDEHGNVYRVAGVMEDITEQKHIEQEREELLAGVRHTRDRLVNLLESMQEGFCAIDHEERFTYVNRGAEQLLRTTREDLLGRVVWDVCPHLKNSVVQANIRRALRDHEIVHFVHQDEILGLWLETRAFPMPGGISVLFQDVTERHRAEEVIRESERSFRALGNSIPQLAWMADRNGNIFWYNQRWHDFVGVEPGKNEQLWSQIHHPEHYERVRASWARAVSTGTPWEDTFPMRSRTGEYRWFLTRAVPIANERGEITRWFGTNTDVTEQTNIAQDREHLLRRERHAREEAEEQRTRLTRVTESRATLMRGFSHDVKNPLGAADGYLQLLESGIFGELQPKQFSAVQNVRRSIQTALSLIEDLLSVARDEGGDVEIARSSTDVRHVVGEAAREFQAQAEAEHLTLDVDADESVPRINTDARRVRQIIANLLSNAVKYTEEGGVTVSVHTRVDDHAPGPGPWIAIDVRDTGPGIPEDQQDVIFDEFRRARGPTTEPGAGIGLAISRKIARALGGEITLRSTPGAGSTFTLWLPAS